MCHFTLVAGAGHPGVDARHRRSDSLIVGWERSTEIGNTTDATMGLVLVLCSRTIRIRMKYPYLTFNIHAEAHYRVIIPEIQRL